MAGKASVIQSQKKAWWQRLRTAQSGAVDTAAYLLIATIVGIGAIVGLATVRDQFVQELGDIAIALENLDQSYSFTIGSQTSSFSDMGTGPTDPDGSEPAGISLQQPASEETDN
jgi:hypothetical protein